MKSPAPSRRGSTLMVTLATLATLAFLAGYTLLRVRPRVRMAYQNAAWQEARVAAEAGIDSAMNDLLLNATGFSPGAWTYWQEEAALAPSKLPGKVKKSLKELPETKLNLLFSQLAETKTKAKSGKGKGSGKEEEEEEEKSGKSGKGTSGAKNILVPLSDPGDPAISTASLFLDNVKISAARGLPAEADVQLWALEPSLNPHARWYRIRSMGTCPLPPTAYEAPAALEASLRRFSLRAMRPSLRRNDVGNASTVRLPNVSRSVEVLVEPILSFELALWTDERLSLTSLGDWCIDSFDSSDATKSAEGGLYPGAASPLVQANGHLASSASRTDDTLKRPPIAANGVKIKGAVATNGGDDPATTENENVSGTTNIDPKRIHDDFSRQMIPLKRPTGEYLPVPLTGTYLTGPTDAPTMYSIHGNLSQLKIAAPATGQDGAIALLIDGNVDLAKPLILPPTVLAVLYVRGNITFRDNVNSGPWNSNRAGQLLIFADAETPQRQTLQVLNDSSVCAAFYGPRTDVTLDGRVNWMGSLNALSFHTSSSGSGGIHYDEALSTVGPTIGFRISRFIEDVRE